MKYQDKKLGRYRKGVKPFPLNKTDVVHMKSKFPGTCTSCKTKIKEGEYIRYHLIYKEAKHERCK